MTAIPFSVEFFPPKTVEGKQKLQRVVDDLQPLQPEYYSVTYGAGGSTRHQTRDVVVELARRQLEVAPHLSFGADDEASVRALLQDYKDQGIRRLVALRGDLPSGMGQVRPVYANQLVQFVRQEFGDWFHIAVACYPEVHPQAKGYEEDVAYLANKLSAGADEAITQYFYNLESFLVFREHCSRQGIDKPLVPGIMPITNMENLVRFSENCGADIPRWLRKGMAGAASKEALIAFGEDVVTRLCEGLIREGVPAFHFYSMNQSGPVSRICRRLGLGNS